MEKQKVLLSEDLYAEHLEIINNVKFTPREIDIISCLLNARRTSQISSILSISPRTVTTHFRNIMLRLNCNSQEGIVDFIEKSKKLPVVRAHYSKLVMRLAFEKSLREISKLRKEVSSKGFIISLREASLKTAVIEQLQADLAQANIASTIQDYPAPKGQETYDVFLVIGQEDEPQPPLEVLDLSKTSDYYQSVIAILHKLFPDIESKNIFTKFTSLQEGVGSLPPPIVHDKQTFLIRSDLVIPTEAAILHRPLVLGKIHNHFAKQEGIQTIALVGPGGAGKTTIARTYAYTQKIPVTWEINAETQETLKTSFENLSQALAKTQEDINLLGGIQNTQNPILKEEKILQFVKDQVRRYQNWLFIFDNVEKLTDIRKYFPQDSTIWGEGKIILTTRNSNIQNNASVDAFISIGELTSEEKQNLFIKITNHGNPSPLVSSQADTIKKFLDHLPSYPLDVSVAACYLKTTQIPYETYLQSLMKYDKEFESVQQNILQEIGTYTKTRYGIITLSLHHLIETHPDFKDLILLVSLLDSQNIPRELLNKVKPSPVVDNFVYNLKKYSLITREALLSCSTLSVFSIHRSTQAITLAYLIKLLNLNENKHLTESMGKIFTDYVSEIVDNEKSSKNNFLIPHCEMFLSHADFLTPFIRASIGSELGDVYRDLGNYEKAKHLYEEYLTLYRNNSYDAHPFFARTLAGLGCVYREQGNYDQAKNPFEESLVVYKKNSYENHPWFAWTLTGLGNVYRDGGEYAKAERLYEQSLAVYKKNSYDDHPWVAQLLACQGNLYRDLGNYKKAKHLYEKTLTYYKKSSRRNHLWLGCLLADLGDVYRELGNCEKAKECLEESLSIYKENKQETHPWIACSLEKLGKIYGDLGDYEKATRVLTESLAIYRKTCRENHPWIAQTLGSLGSLYIDTGEHIKAKETLLYTLHIYEKIHGQTRVDTAHILTNLGIVYSLEDDLENAEKFLIDGLTIFEKNNHPSLYHALENLSDLYLKKSANSKNAQEALGFKEKAMGFLKQSLRILELHFPKRSPHLLRIQSKLL